jgi:hypothetical protein
VTAAMLQSVHLAKEREMNESKAEYDGSVAYSLMTDAYIML